MIFPFGIEKEAEIYCNSAKYALSRQAIETEPQIVAIANNLKNNEAINLPYKTVLNYMVTWVEGAVSKSGWNLHDEDGVSWRIGIFAKSYIRATNGNSYSFDDIFKTIFINYFRNK